MNLRKALWHARTRLGTRFPALGFLAGRHHALMFHDTRHVLATPVAWPAVFRERLIFLHIPKTGATTVSRVAEACSRVNGGVYRHFPIAATVMLKEGWSGAWERIASTPRDELEETTFVQGHFPYGVHRLFPGRSRYLTLLRDPVAREVSVYNFSFQTAYLEKDQSLEALLERRALLDNPQTRLIAGREYMNGPCTDATLGAALDNLERDFALVGIVEDAHLFIRALLGLRGWPAVTYAKSNVTKRKLITEPDSGLKDALRDYHAFDQALYDAVCWRWQAWKREHMADAEPADEATRRLLRIPAEQGGEATWVPAE